MTLGDPRPCPLRATGPILGSDQVIRYSFNASSLLKNEGLRTEPAAAVYVMMPNVVTHFMSSSGFFFLKTVTPVSCLMIYCSDEGLWLFYVQDFVLKTQTFMNT